MLKVWLNTILIFVCVFVVSCTDTKKKSERESIKDYQKIDEVEQDIEAISVEVETKSKELDAALLLLENI